MADGITVSGNVVATDDVGGMQYQVVKIVWGANDTINYTDDASGKRLPITGTVALSAGSNNIGDVDVLTLPGSLTGIAHDAVASTQVGVPAFAVRKDSAATLVSNGGYGPLTTDGSGQLRVATLAALRTTDTFSAALASDKIMVDKTELTPKFAFLNAAAATADQTVIASVTSKKLRVLSLRIMGGTTAGSIFFETGTTTAITETWNFDVRSGINLGFSPVGHFETAAGQALTCTTATASATCAVGVVYIEV